jgi:hypothetical protein
MRMRSPHATDCAPDTNTAQGVVVELMDGVGVTLDDGSGMCHPATRLSPRTRHSATPRDASHGRLRRRCRHGLVTGTIFVHLKQYLKRYGMEGEAPFPVCMACRAALAGLIPCSAERLRAASVDCVPGSVHA